MAGAAVSRRLRIALAQVNPVVGDFDRNTELVVDYVRRAAALGADVVALPELVLTGYPPEDLLLKPQFVLDNMQALRQVMQATAALDIVSVVGFVDVREDLFNAAAVLHLGELIAVYHKQRLPTYGVFDEDRYFQAGNEALVTAVRGMGVGVSICEDIWSPGEPLASESHFAEVILNINGSPYHAGKGGLRRRMVATRAADYGVIIAYVNIVGGQDELLFDGGSFVVDERGEALAAAHRFAEELLVLDVDAAGPLRARLHDPRRRHERRTAEPNVRCVVVPSADKGIAERPALPTGQPPSMEDGSAAEVYVALVLGTRDYVRKNGFRKVVIGLSGGIDSSLTAVIAADALGPENVTGVAMPSRFSSPSSLEDARELAANLGIELLVIPIEPAHDAYLSMLATAFAGTEPGVAEENIQARIRGNILMALSNKFGSLLLSTGNKSELATGYTTLYGDMAGGFAVLKDVFKTLVYELARHRNCSGPKPVIPPRVLAKEPAAELRPGQRDVDTLPPYPALDGVLRAYVEEDRSYAEIVAMGFDESTVRKAIALVDHSEYKRRQAPPGIKITPRAFGRDRRMPITNHYYGE